MTVFLNLKGALEDLAGRPVDLVEREAVEASPNYIRRRQSPRANAPAHTHRPADDT